MVHLLVAIPEHLSLSFLHPLTLSPKVMHMAVVLRCRRCELTMDSVMLLLSHEESCYDTPPPRSRIRRWRVPLSHCRSTSSMEEPLSAAPPPPRKRPRRWCIPLTCSVTSSAPLVHRTDSHYRCLPLSREPLARDCTEREAHERYRDIQSTFWRMSGGLSDSMKQEPWYITGLQKQPHDRCGFYCGSFLQGRTMHGLQVQPSLCGIPYCADYRRSNDED